MGFKRSKRRNRVYGTGKNHPGWLRGDRGPKNCRLCGVIFTQGPTQSIRSFWKQKFCSKACADKGGVRHRGAENSLYRPEARRRNRGGPHKKWVNAVLARDHSKCRNCGAEGVELHAHHIKSFRDFPELRFDLENGITLCFKCHWNLHAAQNENAVNSVDTLRGNTEPSKRGNLLEGVTTRGRAYRRWQGQCDQCGTFISKPLSDISGKQHLFCSRRCATRYSAGHRTEQHKRNISLANSGKKPTAATRAKMSAAQKRRYAKSTVVISSTSAAPEREEIV